MPPTTRRWCDTHRDMGPHIGTRCIVCTPDAPTPAPAAVPALDIFAPPKLTDADHALLGIVWDHHATGVTDEGIRAAKGDTTRLRDLEMDGWVTQRADKPGWWPTVKLQTRRAA